MLGPSRATRARIASFVLIAAGLTLGVLPSASAPSITPAKSDAAEYMFAIRSHSGAPATVAPNWSVTKDRVAISDEVLLRMRYVDEKGNLITSHQIERFLLKYRSPMASFAENIVRAGNRYNVDPKLVVAIAGVESTFGARCLGYNAWGWNGGRKRWHSWNESIEDYTRLLSEKYPSRKNIKKVAKVYNPNTPDAWGRKVKYLMSSIEKQAG